MSYEDDLKIIKEQFLSHENLDTMEAACCGIIDAINGIRNDLWHYSMHLTDLWDKLGLLRVAVKALGWDENGEDQEAVDAIAYAERYYANTIALKARGWLTEKKEDDGDD